MSVTENAAPDADGNLSVLYSTLNQITGEAFSEELWDYGESSHFDGLWDITWQVAFHSQIPSGSANLFLLIGGTIPREKYPRNSILRNINFASHFSALSWAAAHLIALSRLNGDQRCGIVIIDPSVPTAGAPKLLRQMFRKRACDVGGAIRNVIHLINPSLEEIQVAIRDLRTDPPSVDFEQCRLLSTILHSTIVSERQDHHAIGNVLSSYILKNEAGDIAGVESDGTRIVQGESMPLQYQITTLCKCIWEHSVSPWRTRLNDRSFGSDAIDGEVLLIDDMATLWEPVLSQALPKAKVSAVGSPEVLAQLPSRLASLYDTNQRVTCQALTANKEDSDSPDFVLFLDLRLLPEKGSSWKKFYKGLAEVAARMHSASDSLPWLGSREERAEWFKWIHAISNGSEAHPEPLLAQIISVIDPTLPIIIFSSSRASDFSEQLAFFGNITTGFRKPTPASFQELRMPVLKMEFSSACERAARVLRVSRFFRRLEASKVDYLPAICEHCEIFIDESGSFEGGRMNISGVALCGSKDNVALFHRSLYEQFALHRSPGATCYDQENGRMTVDRPDNYIPKRPEAGGWKAHWEVVSELAQKTNCHAILHDLRVVAFSYEFPTNTLSAEDFWIKFGEFTEERQLLDVGYTIAIVELLELIVYDVLQANGVRRDKKLTLAVDFASREAKLDHILLSDSQVRSDLREHWGVTTKVNRSSGVIQTARKSIEDRTPLRLVEMAVGNASRNVAACSAIELVRARACLLSNWDVEKPEARWSTDDVLPKPIHYFADFIANAAHSRHATDARDFLSKEPVSNWLSNGLIIGWNQDGIDWNGIVLDWDSGRRVAATQRCMAATTGKLAVTPDYVRAKLGSWKIGDLTFPELRALYSTI